VKVVGVVPIRYQDCCRADGSPAATLDGRPVWAHTLDQAVAARSLDRVIVAHDDDRFLAHLAPWADRVQTLYRPETLSRPGVTTLDVLAFVAEHLADAEPDYLMLLEITHPLRPPGVIDQVVATLEGQPADALVTCRPVHYTFWRQNEHGVVQRIAGAGDRAQVRMYQELIGIGSLFRPAVLRAGDPFGGRVDMVPIDRFWATVDVRDADGLWLAERCLEREIDRH